MKHQGYLTRALKAKDPRFARILGKLGYNVAAAAPLAAEEAPVAPDIEQLRETYTQIVGRRPYHGWDGATLLAKIEEKRAAS